MVDADLAELHRPGMTATELIAAYRADGRDPFIIAPRDAESIEFGAWNYAEQRAAVICAEGK